MVLGRLHEAVSGWSSFIVKTTCSDIEPTWSGILALPVIYAVVLGNDLTSLGLSVHTCK